jgi:outer membrane biosynthesis protein TonB
MNNSSSEVGFESKKNMRALGYTIGVCVGMFLLFFLTSWTLPQLPPQIQDEGVEVNLGNSDQGLGDVAPMIPGEPTASTETNVNPVPVSQPAPAEEDTKLDEDNTPDATPVNPSKPAVKPNPKSTTRTEVKKHTVKTTANPTPAPPRPKAVYAGGKNNGNGGNGADSYNGVRNQGIAGGNGDQGKANGNPNSDSYTGNGGTGHSGIRVTGSLKNRRVSLPAMTDDFNDRGVVVVDILVNADGKVINTSIQPRGTTTTSSKLKEIARRKASQLKFAANSTEQEAGSIIFTFKLQE